MDLRREAPWPQSWSWGRRARGRPAGPAWCWRSSWTWWPGRPCRPPAPTRAPCQTQRSLRHFCWTSFLGSGRYQNSPAGSSSLCRWTISGPRCIPGIWNKYHSLLLHLIQSPHLNDSFISSVTTNWRELFWKVALSIVRERGRSGLQLITVIKVMDWSSKSSSNMRGKSLAAIERISVYSIWDSLYLLS